ncbi:MAG: serine/threonine-protein kinase, partial [Nannocystaceae bacterium]
MSAPPPRTPPGTPTKPGNTGGAHGATNSDDPDGQVTLPRPGSHIEVEARPELSLEGQVIRKNLLRRMFQRDVSPELIDERYILKQSIGKGAKGTVFLAEDGRLDRQLAIKLLHEQDSPIERTRLIREGQALAKLRHENIVQVYDAQNYEGQVYLAMEYIAGTTLRTWQREKSRGFRELLDVYRQAGAGLAAAHKAGFVHRDFKPENVLVEQATGRVCVVDFGLVKQGGGARPSTTLESPGALRATPTYQPRACDVRLTATHQAAGTPLYMSKEAFFLGHADEKSDQFSFCVALYLALYGHYPLTGTDPPASYADLVEAVDRGIIHAPPRGSKVPSWVFRVLARGMHAEATERYPSMQALLADLDHGRRRRRFRQFVVGASFVLGGVTLGAIVLPQSDPCDGAAQAFEKVWNDEARAAL